MASLFTPFTNDMVPKGIVQGQFGAMNQQQGSTGNLMSIIELIKRLTQSKQMQQQMSQVTPGGMSGMQSMENENYPRVMGKFM